MNEGELDRLLSAPLPPAPQTGLAERVTARILEEQLARRRLDFLIALAVGVAAVGVLPFTDVGVAIGRVALSSSIAQPLGATLASVLLPFLLIRLPALRRFFM
jgi:hypothetical protein